MKTWARNLVILIVFMPLIFCEKNEQDRWSTKSYVEGFPVTSHLDDELLESLTILGQAFAAIKEKYPEYGKINITPAKPLIVARSCHEPIPEICRRKGNCVLWKCADHWNEIPDVLGTTETLPGCGYRGYSGREHIFVRWRGQEIEPYSLIAILRHEYSHEVLNIDDGPKLWAFERIVDAEIKLIGS